MIKFKVGDKVVFDHHVDAWSDADHDNLIIGKTYTVCKGSGSSGSIEVKDTLRGYWQSPDGFVLATASATAVSAVKFKVGDKVKCLRSNGYSVNAVVGDMYEVIALGFSPTNFRLKNVATGYVNHWGGQDFELAQYPASSVSAPADILFAPDSDCGCARNTYKDPGVEHLSICFNYVKGDKR